MSGPETTAALAAERVAELHRQTGLPSEHGRIAPGIPTASEAVGLLTDLDATRGL